MPRLLIRGGRLVDPTQQLDRVGSLMIEDGRIVALDDGGETADQVWDAQDCVVTPGWIDIAVELREPGCEEDETIESGTAAALAGGFTTIACLPNTDPPLDSQATVEFVRHQAQRAANCQVVILASVSKQRQGEQLAELGLLAQAGAVGFTDAPCPVRNPDLLRRALQYCRMFDLPILNRPETFELSEGGIMHDGLVSTVLGLPGLPPAAEDVMTGRDLRLAQATGGRLHLLSLSTRESVEQVRRAKRDGCSITASASLMNLIETDEVLRSFSPHFKVKPPLRAQHHVQACVDGVRDGTIDILVSGHAPRAAEKKMRELDLAPFGAIGLETALPLAVTYLIEPGLLTLVDVGRQVLSPTSAIAGIEGARNAATGQSRRRHHYRSARAMACRCDCVSVPCPEYAPRWARGAWPSAGRHGRRPDSLSQRGDGLISEGNATSRETLPWPTKDGRRGKRRGRGKPLDSISA